MRNELITFLPRKIALLIGIIKPSDDLIATEDNSQGSYLRPAIVGMSWMSAFRFGSRAIGIIKVIILARLLTPAQFGLFGIGAIVLALLETLTETGINVFLIQEKKDIKVYVNDAWLVSILRGILISCVIVISSPIIVSFFNSPDAYQILFFIAFVPFIRGFINPSIVSYQKDLDFRKEFLFRLTIFLVDAAVAIIAAFITRSAISFVYGLIAGAFLEVVLSFIFIKPLPKISFNFLNIRKIVNRGKWVTTYVIFNYIAQEGDNIVVGRLLGSAPLGIYQMGYRLATLPISEISDVVNKVTFPIFVKISEDRQRLLRAFKKTIILTCIPSFFLGFILIILPAEIFIFILGEQWLGILSIIKVLAIYGVLRSIAGVPTALFLALEKQNYVAGLTFLRFFVLGVTIVPFTYGWGIIGSSFSALLSVLVEIPLVSYYLWILFKKK